MNGAGVSHADALGKLSHAFLFCWKMSAFWGQVHLGPVSPSSLMSGLGWEPDGWAPQPEAEEFGSNHPKGIYRAVIQLCERVSCKSAYQISGELGRGELNESALCKCSFPSHSPKASPKLSCSAPFVLSEMPPEKARCNDWYILFNYPTLCLG